MESFQAIITDHSLNELRPYERLFAANRRFAALLIELKAQIL